MHREPHVPTTPVATEPMAWQRDFEELERIEQEKPRYRRLSPNEPVTIEIPQSNEPQAVMDIGVSESPGMWWDESNPAHLKLYDIRSLKDMSLDSTIAREYDADFLLVQAGADFDSETGWLPLSRGDTFEFGRGSLVQDGKPFDKTGRFETIKSVSREHFALRIDESGNVIVEDKNSRFGTYYRILDHES